MPTNYPASLDDGTSLPTKNPGDEITSAEDNTTNGAILAIEAKLGADSSAVTGSIDYLIHHLTFASLGGTVAGSQLPNPSATVLGGVKSILPVSHQFVSYIGTDGLPVLAQPAYSDISGTPAAERAASSTTPAPVGTAAVGVGTTDARADHVHAMGNLTGDVTSAALATTIANSAVTYAKVQNVSATSLVLGRKTAGAGVVEELAAADLKTLLALAVADISGAAPAPNIQIFNSSTVGNATQTSGTWNKPSGNFKTVRVLAIGAGGGGGSGGVVAAGTICTGGGGGGGGGWCLIELPITEFAGSEAVKIGDGGSGGVATAGVGNVGKIGGISSITVNGVVAQLSSGGGAGGAGQNSGVGGTVGAASVALSNGGAGAQSSATGLVGGAGVIGAAGGGGSGGGLTAATPGVTSGGGAGARSTFIPGSGPSGGSAGAGAGGGTGGKGVDYDTSSVLGAAGGGGGGSESAATFNGGTGGAGSKWGGGGGGGGASRTNSGAGGDGAPGIVIVTCY